MTTVRDLLESLLRRLVTLQGAAWFLFVTILRKYPLLAIQALRIEVFLIVTGLAGGSLAVLRVPAYVQLEFWLAGVIPSYVLGILNIYRKTRFMGPMFHRLIWKEIITMYAVVLIAGCTGMWFLIFSGLHGYSTPILFGPMLSPAAELLSGFSLLPVIILFRMVVSRDLRSAARWM